MKKALQSKPKPRKPPARSKPPLGSKQAAIAKPAPAIANLSQLARDHNVSRETLRAWRLEGVDLTDPSAIADRVSKMPGRDQGATGEGESLTAAKTRRARADADRAEIIARRESGSVIDVVAVEELMTQLGAEMRSRLLSWIGTLPPMLEGLDAARIQAIMRAKVTELLSSIHENSPWEKA
jgi:tetrahydromethanopterin S-methyltransferase subunit A